MAASFQCIADLASEHAEGARDLDPHRDCLFNPCSNTTPPEN
jgi:hypothetical protein